MSAAAADTAVASSAAAAVAVAAASPAPAMRAAFSATGHDGFAAFSRRRTQVALLAHIYLRMDRVDLAQKQLRVMHAADEDAALTQLTTAWVHVATGGKHYREAAYIFDELIDKHQGSPLLLNGLAIAKMHMGEFNEAESALVEAASKSQGDADTLINLICCYRHLDKPASFIDRYSAQLRAAHPAHPYVVGLNNVESAFARVAATFAA
ncbi:unnamed protein product [Phaeothamnion confervicola]